MSPTLASAHICSGCGACVAACSKSALQLVDNSEGFGFPEIDTERCTGCGQCEKACPLLQPEQTETRSPNVLAAWSLDDELRINSSSGGVFPVLARRILEEGGIVIGAAWVDSRVRHIAIEAIDQIPMLQGSKYVQSEVGPEIYKLVRDKLRDRNPVLFTGTPCQVAGIRQTLRIRSPLLVTCDILCHGVPSHTVLESYATSLSSSGKHLSSIRFRDKSNGWKRFSMQHAFSDGSTSTQLFDQNPYMLAFLRDYCLRESCYKCRFANSMRIADISLGDFWGVARKHPELDKDDKGVSLILLNSEVGEQLFSKCGDSLCTKRVTLEDALPGNIVLKSPVKRPVQRDTFYKALASQGFGEVVRSYRLRPTSAFAQQYARFRRVVARIIRIGKSNAKAPRHSQVRQ